MMCIRVNVGAWQCAEFCDWPAQLNVLNQVLAMVLLCRPNASNLVAGKLLLLPEASNVSCCRRWCILAVERHVGDQLFAHPTGESGVWIGRCKSFDVAYVLEDLLKCRA
jgi:hypothetical protein